MRKTLEEELNALYDKGFDRYKVKRFVENAAMKVSPIFQTFGIDYGDRTPGMYKLAEVIEELLVGTIDKKNNHWVETGDFRVEVRHWKDDPSEVEIFYSLGSTNLSELKDN